MESGVRRRLGFGSGTFLNTPVPTVDSLGISDELKDKLEDVLIPEQQFTLGRMLGKGMWGCAGIGTGGVCHVWMCLIVPLTLRVWCGFGSASIKRVCL